MRRRSAMATVLSAALGLFGGGAAVWWSLPAALAQEAAADAEAAVLEKPKWQVGNTWIIETLTDRIQGRETEAAGARARLRWRFHVARLESVGGYECYRIDIQSLARGRLRPKATIWCDRDTLFLRQFQAQLAVGGMYRVIRESYDCGRGQFAPVVASLNVLPIGMPAFLPPGSKGLETFTFLSQPLPAGSKDPGIVRFAHTVKQQVRPAGAKALEQVPPAFAKSLDTAAVTEVRLADHQQSVVQLWQKGVPWPVFVDNGRTKAWLVATGSE